jgi:hypothetical protein
MSQVMEVLNAIRLLMMMMKYCQEMISPVATQTIYILGYHLSNSNEIRIYTNPDWNKQLLFFGSISPIKIIAATLCIKYIKYNLISHIKGSYYRTVSLLVNKNISVIKLITGASGCIFILGVYGLSASVMISYISQSFIQGKSSRGYSSTREVTRYTQWSNKTKESV